MIYQIYKPNSKNSGHAMSIQVSKDNREGKGGELQLFMSIIKQSSWNPATKTGSFSGSTKDDSKKVNVKFNEFEVGAMIRAFLRGTNESFFHTSQGGKTQISISKRESEYQGKKTVQIGIGVTKNTSLKFFISIDQKEITSLIACLEAFLQALYMQRIRASLEYQKNNQING